MSRIFLNRKNQITQKYKKGVHNGIDLVGYKSAFDYVVAHSDGKVVYVKNDYFGNNKKSKSYGNVVKIKHNNYYTLYAHLKKGTIPVKVGDKVKQGQIIGYMGNSGYSFGAHVHFEVRDDKDVKIDPTPFINDNLPQIEQITKPPVKTIEELAKEVINGKWGNGQDRKLKLANAGYDYVVIQNRVNEILRSKPKYKVYIVKKGDSLWKIAKKYYGSGFKYKKIAQDNNIKPPYIIHVNQKLKIK